ncbi:hypothetical protein [Dolichospermum circinale]|uniref:hypothetical protein n=1 Tax=Dolichospermum circinale TaxID=109265 RepID=UPI00232AD20D|nr:hypothetical protein [Dolichospermum circinale]
MYKRFDIQIDSPEQTYNRDFELDKDIQTINGIALTSNYDEMLYYRGEQGLLINGTEYFPDNYESKLLMSGVNTHVDKRYYTLENAPVLNGKIKIVYTDSDNSNAPFTPYRVSLYVKATKTAA